MLIHQILPSSRVNGPGNRFVVWTQGCARNCPGCFNPETHSIFKGKHIDELDIVDMIPPECDGVTISGGEPFLQAESLCFFLGLLRNAGFHTMVYTGYTLEELRSLADPCGDRTIRTALGLIDILVDGPYMKDIPPGHPWTGSGNQRVYTLSSNQIRENYFETDSPPGTGEITIDAAGGITTTGIFDGYELQKAGKIHAYS